MKWHLFQLVVFHKTVVQQNSVETLHNDRSTGTKRNHAELTRLSISLSERGTSSFNSLYHDWTEMSDCFTCRFARSCDSFIYLFYLFINAHHHDLLNHRRLGVMTLQTVLISITAYSSTPSVRSWRSSGVTKQVGKGRSGRAMLTNLTRNILWRTTTKVSLIKFAEWANSRHIAYLHFTFATVSGRSFAVNLLIC